MLFTYLFLFYYSVILVHFKRDDEIKIKLLSSMNE